MPFLAMERHEQHRDFFENRRLLYTVSVRTFTEDQSAGHAVVAVLIAAVVAVSAAIVARLHSESDLVMVLPFIVAVLIGFVCAHWLRALCIGMAFGLALLPSVVMVLDDRPGFMRAVGFGTDKALLAVLVCAGVAALCAVSALSMRLGRDRRRPPSRDDIVLANHNSTHALIRNEPEHQEV